MPDADALGALWLRAASGLVIAALPGWWWGPRMVGSILAGGLWNLASLWCLTRLLGAWLRPDPSRSRVVGWSPHLPRDAVGNPSLDPLHKMVSEGREIGPSGQRQVGGWLALKGALLALLVGVVLRAPWLSFIGFGIGFTIMLIIVIASFALRSRQAAGQSHGR